MKTRPIDPSNTRISLKLAAADIFAATEFMLSCQVECSPPRDLEGLRVHIELDDGRVLNSEALGAFNGRSNECNDILLRAPAATGLCTWSAVLRDEQQINGIRREVSEPLIFEVLAHPLSVLVWGLGSAVVVGEQFVLVVALRCECGCPMDKQRVALSDDLGRLVKEVTLTEKIWPGSAAIYFAEVSLVAPTREGRLTWQAAAISSDAGGPHLGEMAEFELHVTGPPECTVMVKTIDVDGRKPLAGATVCMHPFRTRSDETGMATLRLPKGDYRLLVSAANHLAISRSMEIAGDCSTTAALARVKVQNPYADWDGTA